jgi:hypothetical protein
MRYAWNPTKEPIWRKIEYLFTIQFGCLRDWNKAMNMGPWLFMNNYAPISEEYDGFMNPKSIILDKISVWVRVHKHNLLDIYLFEKVIKGM